MFVIGSFMLVSHVFKGTLAYVLTVCRWSCKAVIHSSAVFTTPITSVTVSNMFLIRFCIKVNPAVSRCGVHVSGSVFWASFHALSRIGMTVVFQCAQSAMSSLRENPADRSNSSSIDV